MGPPDLHVWENMENIGKTCSGSSDVFLFAQGQDVHRLSDIILRGVS